MIALFRRLLRLDPDPDAAGADEVHAFLATPPAPMPEVPPPDAMNDDPRRPVYAAVERELRIAGLIR